jgi:hypothetical protein
MDTAKLPTHLHELYPLDSVPLEEIPVEGEEDFYTLNKIVDRIIQKLEDVGNFFHSLRSLNVFKRITREKYFPHKFA